MGPLIIWTNSDVLVLLDFASLMFVRWLHGPLWLHGPRMQQASTLLFTECLISCYF